MEKGRLNNQLKNIATDITFKTAYEKKLAELQTKTTKEITNENINYLNDDEKVQDEELEALRDLRKQQLKQKYTQQKKNLLYSGGKYETVTEEEFFKIVTNTQCVCHFFHQNFTRCQLLDKHLQLLSSKHTETVFFKVDAEKALFLVNKLGIRVLPTLILFKDGLVVDRCVGFSKFSNSDSFETKHLLKYFLKMGMIDKINDETESDSE